MSANGNPGINKLGRILQARITACGKGPLLLDFGTIQEDYSLLTNTFNIPIPKKDYLVCQGVMPRLMPEDLPTRVLVAWVQNDPVVIDVALPAAEIGG